MKYFTHESSYVETSKIGENTYIWHFCHIDNGAKIGKNCSIGQNVYVASDVIIGNNVKIQNNVSLYTGVIIEDDVFLGPSMVFTNVKNPRSHYPRKNKYKTTIIRRGASIGANATIVCGCEIGEFAFVAAGAVVTQYVKPHALVMGIPAKRSDWVCYCGEVLRFDPIIKTGIIVAYKPVTICQECQRKYRKFEDGVLEEI